MHTHLEQVSGTRLWYTVVVHGSRTVHRCGTRYTTGSNTHTGDAIRTQARQNRVECIKVDARSPQPLAF